MKILKDGKVKLGANDTQIGNFVITKEAEYIKIQPVTQMISVRLSKETNMGQLLLEALKTNDSINTIIHYLYAVNTIVPDVPYLDAISPLLLQKINRQPDSGEGIILYENAEILIDNVFTAISALNIQLDDKERESISQLLKGNYKKNLSVYYPELSIHKDMEIIEEMRELTAIEEAIREDGGNTEKEKEEKAE